MCSELPEQELAAALETSGEKAAAAITLLLSLWGSSILPGRKPLRGWKEREGDGRRDVEREEKEKRESDFRALLDD